MDSFSWTGVHLACCFYMTGVIWVIQLIHYPGFAVVAEKEFHHFHLKHTAVMGGLVGPVMVIELLTAIGLYTMYHSAWLYNLLAVVVIWLGTFLWSVPSHNKLSQGQDLVEIQKLVQRNWIRTILWTARSAVFMALLITGAVKA